MARKLRPDALMPPNAGEDGGWAKLIEEIDAQTPQQFETAVLMLRDMVTAHIPQQFEIAKIVLGEEEARRQWKAALAKPRGRPMGPKNPENDRLLLWLYDELADALPSQIKGLPRLIGKFAHSMNKHSTPTAIATHVRRLLKARSKLPIGRGLINSTPR